jgi:hypothetical protein
MGFMKDSKVYDLLNKILKPDDFKIDISMTALFRGKILEQTLSSFCENLFFDEHFSYRLIVNVDPIGKYTIENIKDIISKYFGNNYIINTPSEANLARAVKWSMSNTESKYIFHLEDDWKLLKKVQISHMIYLMATNEKLHFLRFPWGNSERFVNRQWFGFEPVTKFNIACCLYRGEIVRNMANQLVETKSPEKQLERFAADAQFCIGRYFEANSHGHVTMDLGRKWKARKELPQNVEVSYFENKEKK